MNILLKILEMIADLIKSWIGLKNNQIINEREIRLDNKDINNKVNKDIEVAHETIESNNIDKLNEILK